MEGKITIGKTYLKYAWRWKIKEDTCLICQQEFDTACHRCRHPIECIPCIGLCAHTFHYHCITEWLETSKHCPLCRSQWEYRKIFKFENK